MENRAGISTRFVRLAVCTLWLLHPFFAWAEGGDGRVVPQPQDSTKRGLTKEDVMAMDYDDLMEVSFDDLMDLAEAEGFSVDELMEMAMNRKSSIASRKAETLFEAPLATYVITREDILQSGYSHIPELFNMVPGALVRQKTNGNYDVTFHGLDNIPPENAMIVRENSMILLMIDNRVVYDQFSGGIFWETLPVSINDIEHIDIIMGAGSALYGPNAMTGVINIVTIGPSIRTKVKGIATAGMHGERGYMLNAGMPLGNNFSLRASGYFQQAQRFDEEYYSYTQNARLPYDAIYDYKMRSPFLGDWSSREVDLALQRYGLVGNLYYVGPTGLNARVAMGTQNAIAQTAAFSNFVTPLNRRITNSYYASAVLDYRNIHIQANMRSANFNLDEGKRTPYNTAFKTKTFDIQANGVFDIGYGVSVQPGVGVRHTVAEDDIERANSDPLLKTEEQPKGQHARPFMKGEQDMDVASFSTRIEHEPLKSLWFIGGLRYDLYAQLKQQALSWQLLAVYKLTPNHLVRANYSRASRTLFHTSLYSDLRNLPVMNNAFSRYSEGLREPLRSGELPPPADSICTRLSILGNDNLSIPTLDFYELAYRGRLGEYLEVDASLFLQVVKNFDAPVIDSVTIDTHSYGVNGTYNQTNDYRHFDNLGMRAGQLGLTLGLTSRPFSWLHLRANATIQRTRLYDYKISRGAELKRLSDTRASYRFRVVDLVHTSTPTLYGALGFTVLPLGNKKLTITADMLWRTNQVAHYVKIVRDSHPVLPSNIAASVWANISVSYSVLPGVSLYATCMNLGPQSVQYSFTDEVKITAIGGLRLDF